MTGVQEKIVLAGAKSPQQALMVARKLIEQLIDPVPSMVDLTLGEEQDLLYLIRLASLRNLCYFSFQCPTKKCKHKSEHMLDIRRFKRKTRKCADLNCPCQVEMTDDDVEELASSQDSRATWKHLDLIPEDHLKNFPPDMRITLEESGKVVECQPMLSRYKGEIGSLMMNEDKEILTQSLLKLVVSIDGVTKQEELVKILDGLSSWDRVTIRDFVTSKEFGVDTEVRVTCPACDEVFDVDIPMTANFFLPRRVR